MITQEEEIWLPIKGYEGRYEISNLGRVKSLILKVAKILRPGLNGKGYPSVSLHKSGSAKSWRVHALVAAAFLGHTPDGTTKVCVDHINNIRTDNRAENLQLISNRENMHKNPHKNKTSKYIGVSYCKWRSRWRAKITHRKIVTQLGSHKREIDAARAYKKALDRITKNLPAK